jgi:hypothetical protein
VKSAKEISELAGLLGTHRGLRLVQSEMDSYCDAFSHDASGLSSEEIANIDNALRTLSGAILDMRRVVTAMLAEAGVVSNHVG